MTGYLSVGAAAIAATLTGAYAAVLSKAAHAPVSLSEVLVGLEMLKLETVSVPVVRQGKIAGYVIARITISAPTSEVKTLRPALIAYATEAVFRALYEEPAFDFSGLKVLEMKALADRIALLANERLGRPIVHASIIDGLNFVEASAVRAQKTR